MLKFPANLDSIFRQFFWVRLNSVCSWIIEGVRVRLMAEVQSVCIVFVCVSEWKNGAEGKMGGEKKRKKGGSDFNVRITSGFSFLFFISYFTFYL